jgi:hypothetical protein
MSDKTIRKVANNKEQKQMLIGIAIFSGIAVFVTVLILGGVLR